MTKTKAASAPQGTIHVGVGGWTYAPWRGTFYPAKLPQRSELGYASRHLTSIEINGTYYGAQKPESFAKWHDETPDDFVFAVKAPRYATNRRVLAEAGATIDRFFTGGVMELKRKLGPINWQFMPTKTFDPVDFAAFLALLPAEIGGHTLRHAAEVRHASFQNPDFIAMARARGVAVVVAGDSRHPQIADGTAGFVYARIMGTTEAEPRGYAPGALDAWADRARTWAKGDIPADLTCVVTPEQATHPKDVYLYVISGHKQSNPAAAGDLKNDWGETARNCVGRWRALVDSNHRPAD